MTGVVLALGLVLGLLVLLGAIVRFSVISTHRTRRAKDRMRTTDSVGVARVVGFDPPPAMIRFFAESPAVLAQDLVLVDEAPTSRATWEIAHFIPMTQDDVREWRAITGVDGLPFAVDPGKGTYYVFRDGTVRLASPDRPEGEIVLAPSFEEFARWVHP